MFKKQALVWLSVILFVCLIFTFAACDADTHTVTYDKGNNAATGTAPETKKYGEGDKVTAADNPYSLDGYVFDGWKLEGSDKVYQPQDQFDMPAGDVKLVAQWAKAWEGHKLVSVADVLAQIPDEATDEIDYKYCIDGTVKSIDNATFGQMTLEDETGAISVYGTQSADGSLRYDAMDEKPVAGDYVVLFIQNIKNHLGKTKEINNAWIVHFEKPAAPSFDINDYTEVNVSTARGKSVGDKVLVEGVVARITYANGKKPNGFFLVDNTESIYVFDSQIAPQVNIGDRVKIAGARDNWILDTEKTNAAKFGYTGCIQLTDAHLVEKVSTGQAVDYTWVTETTVKEIMDTPASENITTTIYKVNALVKKVEGTGFINYYFDDIDGKTGSYAYTQCNGSDFDWLDEFDGKICTVYLSAINAKSSATGCLWRFVPIQVAYESYSFNEENAPQFALDYYAVDQFETVYRSDPALEVITSVGSELLGFENVTLSYASDNEASVRFDTADGKTVMHTGEAGSAQITITAEYKTYRATEKVTVTVEEKPEYNAVTVAEAIASTVDTEVTVKGIVGPSLVNKVGFYLIDDTGVIAVETTAEEMATVSLGDEVTIKGTRTNNNATQICLLDSTVLLNEYGEHEYSTATFIEGKTLAEVVALGQTVDCTTKVYVVEVEIKLVESKYYANIYVTDGDTELRLYCSGVGQYGFLKPYDGQRVTVELVMCNWNGKNYVGAVLSVTDSDEQKTVNQLNFNK